MCFSRTCALKRWVTATALRPSTAPWRWGRTCLSPAARCSTGLLLDWRIRLSSSRLLSVHPTIHSLIIHPLIQPLVSVHTSISYPSIHSPFHLRIGLWIDRLNIWTKKSLQLQSLAAVNSFLLVYLIFVASITNSKHLPPPLVLRRENEKLEMAPL